jgi:hypothetical protein
VTDDRSVSKSWNRAPSGAHDQIMITCVTVTVLFLWGALSDKRSGLSFYVPLALASAAFLGSSPLGLETIFYCFRFETSLFVASYDSQGHGGDIRPRLHKGVVTMGDSQGCL